MLWTTLARKLERGWLSGRSASLLSRPWELIASRGVARPLHVGTDARIVTVGGATLGGSYRTPLALAVTRLLAESGAKVSLVGHAYRADPGRARWVVPDDGVEAVGDEALDCARQLVDLPSARVVVAPSRQLAVDFALAYSDLAVLDGPLQLRPRPATLALLGVDASAPWGAGACPPCGDLRAPAVSLVAASDRVIAVGNGDLHRSLLELTVPLHRARLRLRGARGARGARTRGGEPLVGVRELRGWNVGLWTSVGRPSRVLELLTSEGVFPRVVLAGSDHAHPSSRMVGEARAARARGVEVWLCTTKCQVHVGGDLGGSPVYALDVALTPDPGLVAALTRPSPGHSLTKGASATSGVREAHA